MTVIGWLVVLELAVGAVLLVWLMLKALRHAKHSEAEVALEKHLAELEAAKAQRAVSKSTKENSGV